MMRIAISPGMMAGHVIPALAIAEQLVARGVEVVFCAEPSTRQAARAIGARPVATVPAGFTDSLARATSRHARAAVGTAFARASAHGMSRLLVRQRVDAALVDQLDPGAALALTGGRVPWASLATSPAFVQPQFHDWPNQIRLAAIRRTLDLPHSRAASMAQGVSPRLHLVTWIPELTSDRVPPATTYVGDLSSTVSGRAPSWWRTRRGGRPRILLSLSTSPGPAARRLMERFLARLFCALEGLDLRVLVTSPLVRPVHISGVDVRAVDFLDHGVLLPHADLLITHGGWGSITRALRHATPMLIAPFERDQHYNAGLCAERSLAFAVEPRTATVGQLRACVVALLSGAGPLDRPLARMARRLSRAPSVAGAARMLEQLALGG
jgi:UDP:flavonoid glycosyltransferase YjiC (YdhE family)